MPRRILNGWQWPGSPSSASSESSTGIDERSERHKCVHCVAAEREHSLGEKTDRRPRPRRSNARTVVPKRHVPTVIMGLLDSDTNALADPNFDSEVRGAAEHFIRSRSLLRWQLAALGLGVLAIVEMVVLCLAVF